MRQVVKRAKVLVINHLTRHARGLRSKKGSEQQKAKNVRRAEKLIKEIEIIKDLKFDVVTKRAVKEHFSAKDVSKETATLEERAFARLACHEIIQTGVQKIKESFPDHEINLLQEYNVGRRRKKKKKNTRKTPRDDRDDGKEERNDRSDDEMSDEEENVDDVNITKRHTESDSDSVDRDGREEDKETSRDDIENDDSDDNDDESLDDSDNKQGKDEHPCDTSKSTSGEFFEPKQKLKGSKLSSVKHKQLSSAKADSNIRVTKSKRESILGDDGDDAKLDISAHCNQISGASRKTPSDFRMLGRKAFQSSFIGSLSSEGTGNRKQRNKDPGSRTPREAGQQRRNNINHTHQDQKRTEDTVNRRKVANPCRVDLAVKQKLPPAQQKKDEQPRKSKTPTADVHPSWEASKRRRQQESTLVEFQGKKIKFDDD
ncbi:serum response factor-binding protein 1-like isoform X2 [Ptychodera flava]